MTDDHADQLDRLRAAVDQALTRAAWQLARAAENAAAALDAYNTPEEFDNDCHEFGCHQ